MLFRSRFRSTSYRFATTCQKGCSQLDVMSFQLKSLLNVIIFMLTRETYATDFKRHKQTSTSALKMNNLAVAFEHLTRIAIKVNLK